MTKQVKGKIQTWNGARQSGTAIFFDSGPSRIIKTESFRIFENKDGEPVFKANQDSGQQLTHLPERGAEVILFIDWADNGPTIWGFKADYDSLSANSK